MENYLTAVILASVAGVSMNKIVRQCGMELVNTLYMTPFVSVMMLRYWIFRSSVARSTSRAWLCTSLAKNVNFCLQEIKSKLRQKICVPLCKKIRMNNDHTVHRSMIKRLDVETTEHATFRSEMWKKHPNASSSPSRQDPATEPPTPPYSFTAFTALHHWRTRQMTTTFPFVKPPLFTVQLVSRSHIVFRELHELAIPPCQIASSRSDL